MTLVLKMNFFSDPFPQTILPKLRERGDEVKPFAGKMIKANNRQMLSKTRKLLDLFFKPFNIMLANMLCDDSFMWSVNNWSNSSINT